MQKIKRKKLIYPTNRYSVNSLKVHLIQMMPLNALLTDLIRTYITNTAFKILKKLNLFPG
jgi:hypothetical protein